MGIFNSMDISATGLTAQRLRLDTISNNIANASTTRTPQGGAYRRQRVVFSERNSRSTFGSLLSKVTDKNVARGVRVVAIEKDPTPLTSVYDPTHPDADTEGYVMMPNVNIITEMVDMISAARSYEANMTALDAAKSMISKALEIGK